MARVFIPPSMRPLVDGQTEVEVAGATVRQLIDALEAEHPGVRDRLCDADGLRPDLAVSIDGALSGKGLLTPVGEDAEVHFLPAIGGG